MAPQQQKEILVFADWTGLDGPRPLGNLTAQRLRGREIFVFEYDEDWLKSENIFSLDPNLSFYQGKQYLSDSKPNFGMFLDSCPDRWGKLLMRRREAVLAKRENRTENILTESDYLLGVYDGHRLGGLRFKLGVDGNFLNDQKELASPPWASLRELENASLQLEKDDSIDDPNYIKWLWMLLDPGSSLGGARPKATVIDEHGHAWMAKFPSANDSKDIGAWEMVLHHLAIQCGIVVPKAKAIRLSGRHHTFLSKRFDRTSDNLRIHFSSAMTMLGYMDGASNSEGLSYLEIVEFIMQTSPSASEDLEQLWRRIVFNILVSNTDDHLRNHGFLLYSDGWRLSPAYDVNPNEYGTGLTLNITDSDNSLNVDLALVVSKYFKINSAKALKILGEMQGIIKSWQKIAKLYSINRSEIDLMKNAFRV